MIFGNGAHIKFKNIVFNFEKIGKKNDVGTTLIRFNEQATVTEIVKDINNAGGKIG